MHRCFPCATISDFVIMPDHVHFLLIVDYSQDPTFSPLWATHRLMDAAEILWALERGTDGGSAPEPLAALAQAIAAARANRGQLIVGNHAVLPQWKNSPIQQGFGGGKPPSLPRRQPPFRASLMSARARRCCPVARS